MTRAPSPSDLERLLKPISAEAPSGASLRYEGTYDKVREARREDDASLPQGVWTTRLKTADWSAVRRLCEEALGRRSKDLQIAVWLAEAWVQLCGFDAVEASLRLVEGLCERYWDALFPELDLAGPEPRENLVDWMDEALARKLRLLPIVEPPYGHCLADLEAGRRPLAEEGDAAHQDLSRETFLARLSLTEGARRIELRRRLAAGLVAAGSLEGALGRLAPRPASLRRTKEALRSLCALVEETMDDVEQNTRAPDPAGATPDAPPAAATESAPRHADGPVASRADAYRRLAEAADYLLRTEPHSPVPYLVKRAISWGNMSLAELLSEFVSSTDDLVAIHRLLGMRERDE